jgi:hypothetical protein
MTQKQNELITNLMELLPKNEKMIFKNIVDYLVELGYIPQKQKVKDFALSFKHNTNGKIIAKIGVSKQIGHLRLKYFACKNIPQKYIKALYDEAVENKNRYSLPVPPPDKEPILKNMIMKKCTNSCNICTGGNMRYYYKFEDGNEIYRCSAYPILIKSLEYSDIEDLKHLLFEQNNYFMALSQ